MKITEVINQTNKWLEREPSKFEKVLQIVLVIAVVTIFMGAMFK